MLQAGEELGIRWEVVNTILCAAISYEMPLIKSAAKLAQFHGII